MHKHVLTSSIFIVQQNLDNIVAKFLLCISPTMSFFHHICPYFTCIPLFLHSSVFSARSLSLTPPVLHMSYRLAHSHKPSLPYPTPFLHGTPFFLIYMYFFHAFSLLPLTISFTLQIHFGFLYPFTWLSSSHHSSQCAHLYAAVVRGTSEALECSVDTDGDGTPDIEVLYEGSTSYTYHNIPSYTMIKYVLV